MYQVLAICVQVEISFDRFLQQRSSLIWKPQAAFHFLQTPYRRQSSGWQTNMTVLRKENKKNKYIRYILFKKIIGTKSNTIKRAYIHKYYTDFLHFQ